MLRLWNTSHAWALIKSGRGVWHLGAHSQLAAAVAAVGGQNTQVCCAPKWQGLSPTVQRCSVALQGLLARLPSCSEGGLPVCEE